MGCVKADFSKVDFDNYDFFVNKFANKFFDFFKSMIPLFIKELDSYKDVNDEGLFERYMALFGEYIDTDVIPEINCYLNIIDASVAEEKYLNHLSDVLGNPPDVFKDLDQYRNLLTYIVSVYKIKGTKSAYELFFGILGFDIEIIEIEPESFEANYDSNRIYDETQIQSLYDQGDCQPCSGYEIKFSYKDSSIQIFDFNILNLLRAAIEFNEPINAILEKLTLIIPLEDSMSITINEELEANVIELPYYDTEHLYDELPDYDSLADLEAIATHMLLTPSKIAEDLFLTSDFRNNLPGGLTFDFAKSFIKVQLRTGLTMVSEQLYTFNNPTVIGLYTETSVIESKPISETIDNLKITGRIYLSNNTFYSFNDSISLIDEKYINLYFNTF